jgi:hypothetical protein
MAPASIVLTIITVTCVTVPAAGLGYLMLSRVPLTDDAATVGAIVVGLGVLTPVAVYALVTALAWIVDGFLKTDR